MEAYTDDKIMRGSDVVVHVNTGTLEAPALKAVAHCTSSQITNNAETKDRITKNTGMWKKKKVIGFSVSLKCDALVASDPSSCGYKELLVMHKKGEPVYLKYGKKEILEKKDDEYEEGWFIITSIDRTDAAAEDSSFSASFENTGEVKTTVVTETEG